MILDYNNCQLTLNKINKTKTLIGGCFDLIHYGHLDFIRQSAKIADILIIALEPDETIINKKRKPVHKQQQRAELLDCLKYVDFVIKLPVLRGFDQYLQMVKKIRPNYIAVSENDHRLPNKRKQAELVNAELIIINYKFRFSTSDIINS
ncbi:MAG: glycerol-3-phosphate cytidylyltransferase [Patescibacteria group bacterium]|nr:MAG: glycerol-3-phosphate cytidylyltransferase [Patescibacteria group bacterium]